MPPDEDIALDGVERAGGARLYLRRLETLISKWEKLRKLEGERDSLLEPVASRWDQRNWGEKCNSGPDYVVDSLSRSVPGAR